MPFLILGVYVLIGAACAIFLGVQLWEYWEKRQRKKRK